MRNRSNARRTRGVARAAALALVLAVFLAAAPARGDLPPRDWSAEFVGAVPLPYCNAGAGAGLTIGRDEVGLPVLGLVTQTVGVEDVVWLDAVDGLAEIGRCCPRQNSFPLGVLQSLADAEPIDCFGGPSFYAGATDVLSSGRILEYSRDALGPGIDTKCDCGETGDDEWACSAGDFVDPLRRFDYPELGTDEAVKGLAVVQPDPAGPALLAVGTLRRIDFVDPTRPDCTATEVTRVASCGPFSRADGSQFLVGGLAWAGGDELLVADHNEQEVHRLDIGGFTCELVETLPTPDRSQGIAFDRELRVLHLLGYNDGTLHATAGYLGLVGSPPAPVGNALRVARPSAPLVDPIELLLDWPEAAIPPRPAGESYRIWRGPAPTALEVLPGAESVAETTYTDPVAAGAEPLLHYVVLAVDACERLSDW